MATASHKLLPKSYKIQDSEISDFYKYAKLIDAFKYFLCIFNYYKLDVNKFDYYFNIITRFVRNRYKLKEILDNKGSYNNIALIDIDGVLAQFPEYFIQKFNETYKTNYQSYNEIPIEKRNVYKEYYRISGEKANIPLCKNAKEFIDELKKQNFTIILFTNRPTYLYENIAYDTTAWTIKNNLNCDSILFAEDKMLDVIKKFSINCIKLYVEDNISNANNVSKLGVKTFLLVNSLNKNELQKVSQNVEIVSDLNSIDLRRLK